MRNVYCAVVAAALLLLSLPTITLALPPGFVDEGFGYVRAPTGFTFAPKLDGTGRMMLVSSKRGIVYMFPDPDNSDERKEILDISRRICTSGERGMQSVAVHPDFVNNRYVYVYYPWPKRGSCGESSVDGPSNRLARFVMKDDYTLDMDSEVNIFETSPLFDDIHNGGAMAFGKDGYLYVAVGDGGNRKDFVSQDLGMLLGSMIRIDGDGGIPPDNPFTTKTGYKGADCSDDGILPPGAPNDAVCEQIYAYGLRNPFAMAFDPNTPDGVVRIFVNDVGGGKWEETNDLVKGGNYGWPHQEGPCSLNSDTDCAPQRDLLDPTHWYPHSDAGGAAVGCAFVPNGLWPAKYDDAFLYMDFVAGEIYMLQEDPSLYCRNCDPPTPGWKKTVFHEWEWPVYMLFGPFKTSQALYYTTRGSGFNNVRRLYFVGGDNKAPAAVLAADKTEIQAGVTVQFDASGSNDPDFDDLTYNWDFGDGTPPIVAGPSSVMHTYALPGQFVASLTVIDPSGFSDTAYVEITVGSAPTVTMTSPAEGTEFAVGDVFTLIGSAVDSTGKPIPEESLSWEVRQHHNTHYHPFLDAISGNKIVLHPAPSPEDFEASTNSFLEIILTATDSNGVHASLSRIVMPKMVTLEFETVPSGLDLILDDFTVKTPIDVISWENHPLRVEAPDQSPWYWKSWSNNEPQNHVIDVPAKQAATGASDRQASNYQFVATYEMQRPPTPAPVSQPTAAPVSKPTAETLNPPLVPEEATPEETSGSETKGMLIALLGGLLGMAGFLMV